MTDTESPTELVERFCALWGANDLDGIVACFADDAVYHNIPMEPLTGTEAIRAAIAGFMTGVDRIEFRVHHIAAAGDVVLTERTDAFFMPATTIEIPVMGTFEIAGGRITAWRDYFDLNQFMSQMPAAS